VVELEHALVLLDDRVLGLDEDADERFLVEIGHGTDDRKAADEFRDEPELEEILGRQLTEELTEVLVGAAVNVGAEADALAADARLDDLLNAGERAAADEEDVRGVDLDELLVRMLAATLRWNRRSCALENLEERLLHTLARHVTRDRGV